MTPIDELLQQPPTTTSWVTLCASVIRLERDPAVSAQTVQQVFNDATPHIGHWPAAMRLPPEPWRVRWEQGEASPFSSWIPLLQDLMPSSGGGSAPVQLWVRHAGTTYYLRYRHYALSIDNEDTDETLWEEDMDHLAAEAYCRGGDWTDETTNVILAAFCQALRKGTPHEPGFPMTRDALTAHAQHRIGLYPLTRLCIAHSEEQVTVARCNALHFGPRQTHLAGRPDLELFLRS